MSARARSAFSAADRHAPHTLAEPVKAMRHRPHVIQHALYLLGDRRGPCSCLDKSSRLLMMELVRLVSAAEPAKPFHVRMNTLAATLDVTVRTVCRWREALEQAGWMGRHQDISRRRGAQVGATWLTQKALEALGLAPTGAGAVPPSSASDMGVRRLKGTSQFSTKEQPDGVLGKITQEQSQEPPQALPALPQDSVFNEPITPTFAGAALAPDLALLQELGVRQTGVWLLMRVAREHGVRLGTVLQAAERCIRASRSVVAYVAKLLRSGRDWTNLASARQSQPFVARQDLVQCEEIAAARANRETLVMVLGNAQMLSHDKQQFAWRLIAGVVHQSSIEDAARGGIGHWHPMADLSSLAQAHRAGRLFAVEQATLVHWAQSAAAGLAPAMPRLVSVRGPRGFVASSATVPDHLARKNAPARHAGAQGVASGG